MIKLCFLIQALDKPISAPADEDGPDLPAKLRRTYDECAEKRSEQLAQSSNITECRRPASEALKFAVGMIVRATLHPILPADQQNVIISWDLNFNESDQWIEQMGIHNLPRRMSQPFYRVLGNNYELWLAEGMTRKKLACLRIDFQKLFFIFL